MNEAKHQISVSGPADVTLAERKARAVASGTQFTDAAIDEMAIVVRELTSNIIKHADEGTLTLTICENEGRNGIEIRAVDAGPGIADVDQALADGYSTAGSMGCGLGAVHRLMDDVVIESNDDGATGVQVVATRWQPETSSRTARPLITAGAATRAKPGMEHNGDSFIIRHEHQTILVGVIDGLGHGLPAHRASQHARRYIKTHTGQSLRQLFRGVERACRNTRGVVMALARFDLEAETVTVGSVGNVETTVLNTPKPMNVITPRGVLGANAPQPAIREWDWDRSFLFVMHSDGVPARWSRDEFRAQVADVSATVAARELLQSGAEQRDDATVLVVKEANA